MAGQVVIPCLMQMAQSASFFDRYKAVAVLVQLRAKDGKLSPEMSEKIRQVIIAALHDNNENVRVFTVFTLRDFGGQDMIPALQAVAQTDPAPEVNGNSIRNLATTAVAAIQKRAKK
jgi:HEAT repeat protein